MNKGRGGGKGPAKGKPNNRKQHGGGGGGGKKGAAGGKPQGNGKGRGRFNNTQDKPMIKVIKVLDLCLKRKKKERRKKKDLSRIEGSCSKQTLCADDLLCFALPCSLRMSRIVMETMMRRCRSHRRTGSSLQRAPSRQDS